MKAIPLNIFIPCKQGQLAEMSDKQEQYLTHIKRNDYFISKRIELSKLEGNQSTIDLERLSQKINNKWLTTPEVCLFKGKYIIRDGHHTVISRILKGQKAMMCKFVDLDKIK